MITVITPTWERHELLLSRAIPSVAAQSVPVRHIVVSDGPDPVLRQLIRDVDVTYLELDAHPDDECNVGAHARNRGLELVNTELVAYLDDDNAFRPDHLSTLAEALENSTADFAYSRMQRHGIGDEVGAEPPGHGRIDTSILMHRFGTPARFGYWPPEVYEVDWALVRQWMAGGATWAFVPKVTVDYYAR